MCCSSTDFPVHGILQARILEWVAISFSGESSQPRDRTCISAISRIGTRFFFTTSITVEAKSHLQQHYSCGGGGGLVTKLCPTLATPWIVALQTPLSMGFPRQEYWGGLPFPSPGDLPDPGIEPGSPALQVNSLPTEPPGKQCLLTVEWINSRVEFYAVMRMDKL